MSTVAQKLEVSHWINLLCFSEGASTEDMTDLFRAFTESENVGAVLGTKYSSVPWQGDMLIIRNAVEETGFESETFVMVALKAIQALEVIANQYLEGKHVINASIVAEIQQAAA